MALEILQGVKKTDYQKSKFKHWDSSSRNEDCIDFILFLSFTLQTTQQSTLLLECLPAMLLSVSLNALKKFCVLHYSKQKMNHTLTMLIWLINWLLIRTYCVAPFVYYTIHTFPGAKSPLLTEPLTSREEQIASICDRQGNCQASSSGDSHFPELLSHPCLALGCPCISC